MRTIDLKTKRPWRKVRPTGYLSNKGIYTSSNEPLIPEDEVAFTIVTQADFLREYYPSGHMINDESYYPDIYKSEVVPTYDDNGNEVGSTTRYYKECVPRYSFAFQQIITTKQLIHLCGYDIQFDENTDSPTEQEKKIFTSIREGWLSKDMEIAFYESARSVKITGDTVFVGFLENGVFGWKVLSYLNGDRLYPHYDEFGNMSVFVRSYFDYDEDGAKTTEWLEVWDNVNLTRMKRGEGANKSLQQRIKEMFGIDGFEVVSVKPHGFPFCPVQYKRDDDGACWSASQDSIDGYELSFSQMAHNNQAFGEPILVFQGEGENYAPDYDLNGTIKQISAGQDDKVSYLQAQSASESYIKQLDTLEKSIYTQSFIVNPPELKSGDLPAAALKILYSPAYEKAFSDSQLYQQFLNGMVRIFLYGYGVEQKRTIEYANLKIKWWIKPYVHISESAIVSDLNMAVNAGFCSKQTASENVSFYTKSDEWDRIIREHKEEQTADLLYTIQEQKAAAENNNNNEPGADKQTD